MFSTQSTTRRLVTRTTFDFQVQNEQSTIRTGTGFAHNKKFNKMDTKKSLTKSAFLSLATFSWLLPRAAFGK
jgi:hypothetical protein